MDSLGASSWPEHFTTSGDSKNLCRGREDEEGEVGDTSAAAWGLIDGSAAEVLAAGDVIKGLE
jgi:hypothetical protein